MKTTEPFDGWPWALAPAVVEHIASQPDEPEDFKHAPARGEMIFWRVRAGGDRRVRARIALKAAMAKGKVRARDPLGAPIEPEWWKFAEISDGGSAINLSSMRKLDHFEVCVKDVLRIWPLATVEVEKPVAVVSHLLPEKVDQAVDALRALYPDGKLPANRKIMNAALSAKLGFSVSFSTLDRARRKAWPGSPGVVNHHQVSSDDV